jgi:hypothetical protein
MTRTSRASTRCRAVPDVEMTNEARPFASAALHATQLSTHGGESTTYPSQVVVLVATEPW